MARVAAPQVMHLADNVCAHVPQRGSSKSLRSFLDAMVQSKGYARSYAKLQAGKIYGLEVNWDGRVVPFHRWPSPELVLLWYGFRWTGNVDAFVELPVAFVKVREGRNASSKLEAWCGEWWTWPGSSFAGTCPALDMNCSASLCEALVAEVLPEVVVPKTHEVDLRLPARSFREPRLSQLLVNA